MKNKRVFLSVVVVSVVVLLTFAIAAPKAFAEMLLPERQPGHACNVEIYVDTRVDPMPSMASCPTDKPILRVYAGAIYHGDATRLSSCLSKNGNLTLCGLCGPAGYGDRLLGPGLIGECVSEADLP